MKPTSIKTKVRALHLSAAVLLLAVAVSAAEKPPKGPSAPKAHPNSGPGGGPAAPKRARFEQIEHLSKMSPDQREKALANVPRERRARIEAGLAKWNRTPEEIKAQEEKFKSLPPEQQKRIRDLSDRIRALPHDRKLAVTQELNHLRNMPDEQRQKRLNSPDLQNRFSADEQEILRETPGLLPQYFF
jgi:hypothetical protein